MTTSSVALVTEYCKRRVAETKHLPRYDALREALFVGDVVAKQFRHAAPNQQLILVTFEDLGWPYCIEDPIPQEKDVCPNERLANAVKRLNLNCQKKLIHFSVRGSGTSVSWRLT